jgi:hypothetical protein
MSGIDRIVRSTQPQYFHIQTGRGAPIRSDSEAEFSKVVKKEPAQYVSETPLRGVAKLGSQSFGFVLDTARPSEKEQEEDKRKTTTTKLQRYTRLYFDVNHNGDLTDDKVIEAEASGRISMFSSGQYAQDSFPPVDVTFQADGTEMQYALVFRVTSQAQPNFQYATAYLTSAAYREGEITLGGKKRRIVLVDYNSDGRFDSEMAFDERVRLSNGTVYARPGDMIYVDPDLQDPTARYGYDATTSDEQQFVGKLLNVDGRFYDVQLTAAGDKLTLTPTTKAVGYVTNPNQGYRAVVYGDQGFLKVMGGPSGKAPLPEGKWKLLQYTIDRTELPDDSKGKQEQSSLLQTLMNAVVSRPPPSPRLRYTVVSARAKAAYPAVEVRGGETVSLPFGPPYKPTVEVAPYRRAGDMVELGLSIVGAGGEVCSALMVNGRQPPAPQFTITGPDDKEVASGKFEYG